MGALTLDIFCRVVDNYGDIGVSWRLARQLAGMPQVGAVRLWVDDLGSFARIEPGISQDSALQHVAGVEVRHWTRGAAMPAPHEVVIEAFACDPPPAFVQAMAARGSFWINLEYLSAEDWVLGCHALPSPRRDGIRKAFFFPGFAGGTGGLPREPRLLQERDRWRADPSARAGLLGQLGLPPEQAKALLAGQARQVLMFAYPDAPAQGLVTALRAHGQPAVVFVPRGVCPGLARGAHGPVQVCEIPFVDQPAFDRILWSSDLNCVRGEDSLVRALWAGRPMLWQIYRQQDDAHLVKLEAFLDRSPLGAPARQAMRAWNGADDGALVAALAPLLHGPALSAWQTEAAQWCESLARQDDLATELVRFALAQRPG